MESKILIIDDEREICEILRDYLTLEGFKVELCLNGEDALKRFLEVNPQLVVLDIMLPSVSGIELCKELRAISNVPIIMLSAKGGDVDKIITLGFGADDYVTKPFSPAEMVARIKAQLRRFTKLNVKEEDLKVLIFGELYIDSKSYRVRSFGRELDLSAKEFEMLWFLAKNKGQVFSKEQIFDHVWGFNEYGDINTITVHIRKIREKIEKDPANPKYIKTVWGIGYKFEYIEGDDN